MAKEQELETAVLRPIGFVFGEVPPTLERPVLPVAPPPLGPLTAFIGTFTGKGFNTIFRPDSRQTPTPLPIPVTSDNILELNLTSETLSFSASLGSVPNRGMVQGDIKLNGVPYLQTVSDITNPAAPIGIHMEPGLWMAVPVTTNPALGHTLARMASIPHGTTIVAQGTSSTANGKPIIPAVDITPFSTAAPHGKIPFASQTATDKTTPRLPQDLTSFIAAGTITQAMLTDPNTVLRQHIAAQTITSTTTISISTSPGTPLFGGGTDNIAFLLGNAEASTPNAQTTRMNATFWIETVEHTILVPIFKPGQPALTLPARETKAGEAGPVFHVDPPIEITTPRVLKVTSTQIQYSQVVFLNFNTLTWPHVSVATLTPAGAISVPPSAW